MTVPERAVIVHDTKTELIEAVANQFSTVVRELLADRALVHVCLTGGSVGIAVLDAIARHTDAASTEWTRVHFWWGDERWLPAGDAERNDQQAWEALLSHVPVPESNIHRFAAADDGADLDAAAVSYRDDLVSLAAAGDRAPSFDITFLGMGPDGHVASLFPHFEQVNSDDTVVSVRDSPKPPPERLSLTLPVLNASQRVWLAVAGEDKASPIGLALAGASRDLVPVAGVRGRLETVFWVDAAAAANVPRDLIVERH